MDTQDVAIFCLRSLQLPKTENKLFLLNGLNYWASYEIIKLCEQLAGQSAKVQRIPSFLLNFITNLFGIFEWGQNISDRLAFIQILKAKNNSSLTKQDLYQIFKVDSSEIIQLEDYFLEYFIRLLKRLRDINFEDVQKQRNLFPFY